MPPAGLCRRPARSVVKARLGQAKPAPVQAAEALLRDRLRLVHVGDVTPLGVERDGRDAEVRLRTRDGLEHILRVVLREDAPRRISCSGNPEGTARWVAACASPIPP